MWRKYRTKYFNVLIDKGFREAGNEAVLIGTRLELHNYIHICWNEEKTIQKMEGVLTLHLLV